MLWFRSFTLFLFSASDQIIVTYRVERTKGEDNISVSLLIHCHSTTVLLLVMTHFDIVSIMYRLNRPSILSGILFLTSFLPLSYLFLTGFLPSESR